jgi:hypothetical protein
MSPSLSFGVFFGILLCANAQLIALGTANTYAIIAYSTVTSSGSATAHSVVTGDIGVSPNTALVGFPPATSSGNPQLANGASAAALADSNTAYTSATSQACPTPSAAAELGGLTLTPGVYCWTPANVQITTALTLSGPAGSVWVFQIAGQLTVGNGASVVLSGGATSCGVFWAVGSSASIGTTAAFQGTLMAHAGIAVNTGASVLGRLFSATAAVTLQTNFVSVAQCANATHPLLSSSTGGVPASSSTGGKSAASTNSASAPALVVLALIGSAVVYYL